MALVTISLQDDYWETFEFSEDDIEFLYSHLLEHETPLTSNELMAVLVEERIRLEKVSIEKRQQEGGEFYLPMKDFELDEYVVFPNLGWSRGKIVKKRNGVNPDIEAFKVIEVEFESGDRREFACALEDHVLNNPPETVEADSMMNPQNVLHEYGRVLVNAMKTNLNERDDFVRIAGRWFPRALLVDVNVGHLNLAEAVLDMEGGGPLPTSKLLETVEMPGNVNQSLAEFSLDFALWNDGRFDEVGPAGQILWFLRRLEPKDVLNTPLQLIFEPYEYDRSVLSEEMLDLEQNLADELSPIEARYEPSEVVEIHLIYPHVKVGSLPLSSKLEHLFPTSYSAPRIRFMLVDGETGNKFPGWVVHDQRYIYGLKEFYQEKGIIAGSTIRVEKGEIPGEVIIHSLTHRPNREWVRTVLVGADGGLVLAMLKQIVKSTFDDRMAIIIPDESQMDKVWEETSKNKTPFERVVVDSLRELTKLNPQSHVHATELYAAVNLVKRCPPGPILSLLASRPWFSYVGDLHFRFDDSERI